ncbi:NAD-dependent epimerase/dehydratase family protein [Pectobacterium atrosepticum]|uniref:NAD-dependent epimerase/dehydratase family protein n=1 Tax=Pectobacterium atrosepticum TaxID=29471 RepID=UPI00049B3FB5|nr:SDR family oxidoreductase [Pectobacterium atrosepticum]GKV86604.1 dTDP-glucose 4,6-dehydratase [Pectobacterium carotovorum subsp. carotovorum]AIA70383.1 dTDP-glucose 4,6-dehydratase [Pectobacterium atrosepticum]AIK13303.1 putative dTDP-glucose 4-6-dehydratase [Pectobacterium atrosepticum]ATY90207.1 NAD-dependent epimerase/dehydratase [Pectobacterium atrosepticum]KFX17129.1 dTDP-glucose 4,6-dehydratase [Pectobacterium atrosepticum]
MKTSSLSECRSDCLLACAGAEDVRKVLAGKHISITGGTGFLGTWIAEMISALNDEYNAGITLDIYATRVQEWARRLPHLAARSDINIYSQDVRSPFEFSKATNFIIHAAGIPNTRVHSSDPLRVYETTVTGTANCLEAATKLGSLIRMVNVSSCLVNGQPDRSGATSEDDAFMQRSGELHGVYAEAKRASETLATIYRNQHRLPISTVRPFTLAGPYHELDLPWAINNFMRDALNGSTVRIHGDGNVRRSYLYGSDAAWWTLTALVKGGDGDVYNLGSAYSISHIELVKMIGDLLGKELNVEINTNPAKKNKVDDLYPNTQRVSQRLKVAETVDSLSILRKMYAWHKSSTR